MSIAQLNTINASIRELLNMLDRAKRDRARKDDVLRILDELENQIDVMISQLAPERITDVRFNAAVRALRDIADKFKDLRESIVFGRYTNAKSQVLDIHESIKHTYRLLLLIKARAPTPVIFQSTPQFIREIAVPEALAYGSPMAAQIYNTLVRKGEATVEDLALELKIDDRTRFEFNNAIQHLITTGYIKLYLTPDNKMVLRPAR